MTTNCARGELAGLGACKGLVKGKPCKDADLERREDGNSMFELGISFWRLFLLSVPLLLFFLFFLFVFVVFALFPPAHPFSLVS